MSTIVLAIGCLACIGGCPKSNNSATTGQNGRVSTTTAISTSGSNGLKLVVLLVIDQLPSWSFERDRNYLDGGIARMIREGAFYPNIQIPFAITYTAPGHTALGTGAPPAVTGILANSWYDTKTGAKPSAIYDPESPVFTIGAVPSGGRPSGGASGARMVVDGLADELRRATEGKGRSIAISLKERGAILAIGRKPDLAIWYDSTQRAMTTSAYYADAAPAWLDELSLTHPIAPRLDTVWTQLTDIDHAAITGIDDAMAGERAEFGMGNAFPQQLSRSSNPAKELRSTPLGDDILLETVYAALAAEKLGQDDVADLLSVSFSSHDYAGHNWGQESWERLDLLLRLDDKLGALMKHLDDTVGAGAYAVVLTSDHGATPLVEHSIRAGKPAKRVTLTTMMETANEGAKTVLGDGQWVVEVAASSIYGSPAFMAQPRESRDQALDAMVATLSSVEGVGYVARTDRIAGDCDSRSGVEALACRSVVLGASGQIFFGAAQNYMITRYTTGTGHGAPTRDDRVIPLIVYAPGWGPKRVDDREISMLQVAPTIAALLGIPSPPAAREPALTP